MRKQVKTVKVGGAYNALPEIRAHRGLDLQAYVDSFVEHGDREKAYYEAGGDGSPDVAKKSAYIVMKHPEVQQAITERSAQKFFALAPVAVQVLQELLTNKDGDPKVRAKIALELMNKIQVEQHNQSQQASSNKNAITKKDLANFASGLHEFIRKNPEWPGVSAGNADVYDADGGVPVLEEHASE